MIIGIDTDVLVHWAMQGAPRHRAVRRFVEAEVSKRATLDARDFRIFSFLEVVDPARAAR